ncbi:hypothetical protein RhiJN_00223 [Ceratobasidium sp. AG-Ba]|nr:hypothetical protein RhiJN_00223 [Ceratobasidium sp. AG-Ba]QRW01256.1 hypothetical protein RhiLY_00253 [Ceratobasidium sp. AG-Ba]
MSAFTRIAMFAFFVLSLSFLVSALPTPASAGKELAARDGAIEVLLGLVAKLKIDVNACVEVLLAAEGLVNIQAAIAALVVVLQAFVAAVVELGVIANVDASVKLSICADIVVCLNAIVHACLELVVKVGLTVCLTLIVDLQAVLCDLIVKLDICLGAIIAVIVKLIVDVKVIAFIHVNLTALLAVLVGL